MLFIAEFLRSDMGFYGIRCDIEGRGPKDGAIVAGSPKPHWSIEGRSVFGGNMVSLIVSGVVWQAARWPMEVGSEILVCGSSKERQSVRLR